MNYIKHLNAFMDKAAKESWLSSKHFTMYIMLFHFWNKSGFIKTMTFRREDLMKATRITSLHTYYRCLRELEKGNYLVYHTAQSRFSHPAVTMVPFDTQNSKVQDANRHRCNDKVQDAVEHTSIQTKLKIYKQSPNGTPSMTEVIDFFISNKSNAEKGMEFWFHFESISWMMGPNPIVNWKALAQKWMLYNKKTSPKQQDDEDYYEPL